MARTVRLNTGYTPNQYQTEIHTALLRCRFGVVVCHRRFGKTVLSIQQLADSALRCEKANPRFGYISPFLKQSKSIAWLYLKRIALKVPGTRINESELFVEFPNGARVTLFGADNAESLRGNYFDGIVCDEVADFAIHIWPEIIRPALSDRQGWALFIGTPKGLDAFYEIFNFASRTPGWYAATYRADETDLPWLPKAELALAKMVMSEQAFRREYLCDFTASTDNTLITIDLVSAACQRRESKLFDLDGIAKVMGVDVARFGDDSSVIAMRQGPLLNPLIRLSKTDNMHLAAVVATHIGQWQPDAVFIDAGRGEGVIDRLRQLGHEVIEVNFGGTATSGLYANVRTEIWDRMREWVEESAILPPEDHTLKADLCTPTYAFNTSNKMVLEKNEDIKARLGHSPDAASALALTFRAPVMPKVKNHSDAFLMGAAPRQAKTSYQLPWEKPKKETYRVPHS